MRRHLWILVAAGGIAGFIISGRFGLRAQDRAAKPDARAVAGPAERPAEATVKLDRPADPVQPEEPPRAAAPVTAGASAATVQEALLRPFDFPFANPTALEAVCVHLRRALKAPVVLDLAALDRKKVAPDDDVVLALKGVRLKTGLKLLLDQVGLTYRVVPEDNLLIITDKEGSEDPAELIWAELRALHRDLHDVQDSVDDLRGLLDGEGGEGPRVHKPTIIEEMPDDGRDPAPRSPKNPGSDAKQRPGTEAPSPGAKPPSARVPLAGPRRRL
jgi:hypothetical protein